MRKKNEPSRGVGLNSDPNKKQPVEGATILN